MNGWMVHLPFSDRACAARFAQAPHPDTPRKRGR
jgi:hypothetical protein